MSLQLELAILTLPFQCFCCKLNFPEAKSLCSASEGSRISKIVGIQLYIHYGPDRLYYGKKQPVIFKIFNSRQLKIEKNNWKKMAEIFKNIKICFGQIS